MVVLTIVMQNNGETVYFDTPIPQVHFMKLLSCSLYNSWHNLKKAAQLYLGEEKSVGFHTTGPLHFSIPRRRANRQFGRL